MTAHNLPPGFDPVLWVDEWDFQGHTAVRILCDGGSIRVQRNGLGQFHAYVLPSNPDAPGRGFYIGKTQQEAIAFANTYAESHGGWA